MIGIDGEWLGDQVVLKMMSGSVYCICFLLNGFPSSCYWTEFLTEETYWLIYLFTCNWILINLSQTTAYPIFAGVSEECESLGVIGQV
jgi:hypothetical protein